MIHIASNYSYPINFQFYIKCAFNKLLVAFLTFQKTEIKKSMKESFYKAKASRIYCKKIKQIKSYR